MVGCMKKRTDTHGSSQGSPPASSRRSFAARLRARTRDGGWPPAGGREYEAARMHAELSVIAEHRSGFDHFSR